MNYTVLYEQRRMPERWLIAALLAESFVTRCPVPVMLGGPRLLIVLTL
jgi:hypothetical protein